MVLLDLAGGRVRRKLRGRSGLFRRGNWSGGGLGEDRAIVGRVARGGFFLYGEGFFRSRHRRERAHLKDGRYVTPWLRHGGDHGSVGGVEFGLAPVREPDHGYSFAVAHRLARTGFSQMYQATWSVGSVERRAWS